MVTVGVGTEVNATLLTDLASAAAFQMLSPPAGLNGVALSAPPCVATICSLVLLLTCPALDSDSILDDTALGAPSGNLCAHGPLGDRCVSGGAHSACPGS